MNKLTDNHFSFKCPMSWDEMEPSANGRFCGKCRKEVFDLTNCSIDEVIALQKKHGTICGSIRVAALAASLSVAACQNAPEQRVAGGISARGGKSIAPADSLDPLSTDGLRSGDQAINKNSIDGVVLPPEQLEKMKSE